MLDKQLAGSSLEKTFSLFQHFLAACGSLFRAEAL